MKKTLLAITASAALSIPACANNDALDSAALLTIEDVQWQEIGTGADAYPYK
jgi:hypothetical protein